MRTERYEEAVEQRLRDTVREQLVSDVPLGAFLSGGIDSSLVVATMCQVASGDVRTFSVGFEESRFDEAPYAAAVARHLGTRHTELYVTDEEARATVPRLVDVFDEPFADSSQIPTLLVSELARRHVTVALSGDGGDEIFGGYSRYVVGEQLWRLISQITPEVRDALAAMLLAVPRHRWDAAWRRLLPALPGALRVRDPGQKVHRVAHVLHLRDPLAVLESFVRQWHAGREPGLPLSVNVMSDLPPIGDLSSLRQFMVADALTYLPDDILVKVDRASMSTSLEARAPFLDHRLIETAWRADATPPIANGRGKRALRAVLSRYVPPTLTDRPKMGFGVPLANWLRGPLRAWAEAAIHSQKLRALDIVDESRLESAWRGFVIGDDADVHGIYGAVIVAHWLERWC